MRTLRSPYPAILALSMSSIINVEEYILNDAQLTIGFFSDSHGVTDSAVAEVMAQCDLAVHAGDIMAAAALADVRNYTKTLAVAGNNDRDGLWDADLARVVEPLPDVLRLKLPSGIIIIEHGHRHGFQQPSHQKLIMAYPDARVIVYGHTHEQLIDQSQTPWILNPGAAGHIRNGSGPKCLVLHIDAQQWRVVAHNFENVPA